MEPKIAMDPFLPGDMSESIEPYPVQGSSIAYSPNNGMLPDVRDSSNMFLVTIVKVGG